MPLLTEALAQTHEALYPRVDSLTRQVEAIATRKPDAAVPDATRAASEALLFDAGRFRSRRSVLEPAPETFAALATALGQALAALNAFETRHSEWSAQHNGFVWRLPRGTLRPVQRLRPKSTIPLDPVADKNTALLRRKILARLDERYDEGFAAGLKAGRGNVVGDSPS